MSRRSTTAALSIQELQKTLAPQNLKLIGHPSENKFAVAWRNDSLGGSIFTTIVPTSEHNVQGHSETPQFKAGRALCAIPGKSKTKFTPTEELPDPISLLAETLIADDSAEPDIENVVIDEEEREILTYSQEEKDAEKNIKTAVLYVVQVNGTVMLTRERWIFKVFGGTPLLPTQVKVSAPTGSAIVYSTKK